MEMFPFQTALVCSSSYPPVPCQSVVQNPMETVMVHDDSSMSSIPSNDLHNLSLEHNYNKFDMNYECPMLNNNHAYGSIGEIYIMYMFLKYILTQIVLLV